jgi:L-rhamnose mutarotase
MRRRYCLTLNLRKDPDLIRQYEEYHKKVWPEILESIKKAGIEEMEIYRFNTRLCMIMEVNSSFSFESKQQADLLNEKVQQWEDLMWKYQEAVEGAAQGEKWVLMDKIFDLKET